MSTGDRPGTHSPARLSILPVLLELAIYAALVAVYFLLVLHFLGDELKSLYDSNKTTYAFVTLALISGQGVLLEIITTHLLRVLQRWFTRD